MGKSLIIKGADFSQNRIAPEFTKLGWIGGSTSPHSHIDSGIYWGGNTCDLEDELQFGVTLDITGLSVTAIRGIGSDVNINVRCCVWMSSDGWVSAYFANAAKQFAGINLYDGQQHTIAISKTGMTADGQTYPFDSAPTRYDGDSAVYTNTPIYLDCASAKETAATNRTVEIASALKVHWVKYYRNGTLILDAIPVKRTADGVVCFYDRVSGTYKTRNDGTTPIYG